MPPKAKPNIARTAAAAAFIPGFGANLLISIIAESLKGQGQTAADLKNAETDAAFERELRVQQSMLSIAEGRARVARELAIARRIDTAEEVELEEYFDVVREGKGGVHVDGKGAGIGISGSGKSVTKRVYRFKGWRDGGLETLMAQMNQMSEEELQALQDLENES